MSAYDLSTHLGAYLYTEQHFHANGLVAVVAPLVLQGYVDASGNAKTVTDKILAVNGCLSTPDKWNEFDIEWQAFLKKEGFKIAPRSDGRYVFHTTDFWADSCTLMPRGLLKREKQRIYRHLIDIIKRHSVYRFGYACPLDDFREIEQEFPFVAEIMLGKPGSMLSQLCFRRNQVWADENKYSPSISYIYDRGDEFWRDLDNTFRTAANLWPDEERTISSLMWGNKAKYSPIQAADIVAWECRREFSRFNAKIHRVAALASNVRRTKEMLMLNDSHKTSCLILYHKKALKYEIHKLCRGIIEHEGHKEDDLVGEGKQYRDMDEVAREILANQKKLRDANKDNQMPEIYL